MLCQQGSPHGLDIEFQKGEKSDQGNLTRHLENAEHLVYNLNGLVPMLLNHIVNGSVKNSDGGGEYVDNHECANCALYALQNLSCSNNCY